MSRSVLIHQIENQTFQRTMSSQTNFANALDPEVSIHAQLAVKDEYTFAFLELEDEHSERELERALTGRVETFLREMGDMFTFVGSRVQKLQVGGARVLHRSAPVTTADSMHSWHWNSKSASLRRNTSAKCSSISRFLDDTGRLPEEQPSIGIILCKSKDRLIVEYALKDATLPIGVSSYSVTPDVPYRLQGQLPSADQIAPLLAGID